MFAFDDCRLDSVGEEVLNPSLGLASDAIEIQLGVSVWWGKLVYWSSSL